MESKEALDKLKKTWEYLSLPNKECDLVGKWFAIIYDNGRRNQLFIAKVIKRFLKDEGGLVDNILLMSCLKPNSGIWNNIGRLTVQNICQMNPYLIFTI